MNDTGQQPPWSGADTFDPMPGPDPDFSNLLDFDLDFSDFANGNSAAHQGHQLEQLADELDGQHIHNPFSPHIVHHQPNNRAHTPQAPQTQTQTQTQTHLDTTQHAAHSHSMPQQGTNYFDFSMPYSQSSVPAFTQPSDHIYRPHAPVPPTPNSIELHGNPAQYIQHMDTQNAMFDQRYQMRKEEVCTIS